MKILYCIPFFYSAGGAERVFTTKLNHLVNIERYEIIVVTTDQQDQSVFFPLDERIRVIHLNIDFDAHFNANLLKKYVLHKIKLQDYKAKLRDLIDELEIDICVSLCGKEIDFLVGLQVSCKKIAEIHFGMNNRKQFLTSRHKGVFWRLLGEIRTRQLIQSVRGLDKFVVLTKADQSQWEQYICNVIQIPNPNPLETKMKSTLESKRVISIGKLDPQKGYDMLIDAWCLVNEKHPDWKLDIFGIGEWKDMLESKIKRYKLEGKVNLLGLTSDVSSEYIASSIYVMSSRFEGLPMVLIEAMSCGLPIVSFDCECGPREIINDGIDGFLVKQNDVNILAQKICFLMENSYFRKTMGTNAFEKSKQYSLDKIIPQWVELFESISNH